MRHRGAITREQPANLRVGQAAANVREVHRDLPGEGGVGPPACLHPNVHPSDMEGRSHGLFDYATQVLVVEEGSEAAELPPWMRTIVRQYAANHRAPACR